MILKSFAHNAIDGTGAQVSTTMIYNHVLKVGGGGVRSPVDALPQA